ncbi:MAG: deoxyguanosinetriphosphate triphosphohydrolase [Brachymonas sp.]|jgi:dGTPase|nr:deoxyguanosinetriphosphate triphosphohydrolase [Brachymonas sp.]
MAVYIRGIEGLADNAQHAPWACHPLQSRGRRQPEEDAQTRGMFQRDRDRIVHSSAFRRLVYKTQVFLNHEGDLFRTRLTHTLEVAQIGRSIARALALDEDLVEAIALAHDLGHTPFGHAGQDALNACMQNDGGFEHNMQSLRVVDTLEQRYPGFDGLNLCFETREGILKHCSHRNAQYLQEREPDGIGLRFLLHQQPSLEAQLANLADEIAYNAHDVDDGLRSGLLQWEDVLQVPLVAEYHAQVRAEWPSLQGRRLWYETIRRMLSAQILNVVSATLQRLQALQPANVEVIRRSPPLLGFDDAMRDRSQVLKRFLMQALYRHPQVVQNMEQAQQVIRDLFAHYSQQPQTMPPEFAERTDKARAVADYIAGMTDRFALREHTLLTGKQVLHAGF